MTPVKSMSAEAFYATSEANYDAEVQALIATGASDATVAFADATQFRENL